MGYRIETVHYLVIEGVDELIQPVLDKGSAQGWKLVAVVEVTSSNENPAYSLFWETPG